MRRAALVGIMTIVAFGFAADLHAATDTVPAKPVEHPVIAEIKSYLHNAFRASQDIQTIQISHDRGNITLKGYVQTAEEKELILNFVRGLPGVTNVTDQLQVR